MTTQLDTVQPIQLIQGADFSQAFTMKKLGQQFNLTGLTEVTVNLLQKDSKTISSFKYSTNDITLVGSPIAGTLNLAIGNTVTSLLHASDAKDVDFICDGPWGRKIFRAIAALQIVSPAL